MEERGEGGLIRGEENLEVHGGIEMGKVESSRNRGNQESEGQFYNAKNSKD